MHLYINSIRYAYMTRPITLPSLNGNTLVKLCGTWPTPKFTVALPGASHIVLDIVSHSFHSLSLSLTLSLSLSSPACLSLCSLSDAVKSENAEIYMWKLLRFSWISPIKGLNAFAECTHNLWLLSPFYRVFHDAEMNLDTAMYICRPWP